MSHTAYRSINPATGALLATFTHLPKSQALARIDNAVTAYRTLSAAPMRERGKLMNRVAELLRERKDSLAGIITAETGKTLASAKAEVEKCASTCDHYVKNAETYLATEKLASDASESYVQYDPIGPVLAIMPWNFPFWQLFRFAAPGVMAGNVCLLKHSANVPQCAVELEKLFQSAGADAGLMQNLFIDDEIAATMLADPRVAAVTLTGSVRAGKAVASEAGKNIKKSVLELGGSDPFIVLKDADLDKAASVGAASRLVNAGQSCIAAKRFIVEKSVADEFVKRLIPHFTSHRVGDPTSSDIDMGPLARKDIRDSLARQVKESVDAGAKLVVGGELNLPGPLSKGFFYSPTILTNVTPEMTAFKEETFGPVAPIIIANDEEHAIELANMSEFGLGSTIMTGDPSKARKLATRINSGAVFINGMVKSDPRLPFGGVKDSGFGRELGRAGIMEFVNGKTVWVA